MSQPGMSPVVRRVIGGGVAVLIAVVGFLLYDTDVDTELNGRLGPPTSTAPTSIAATSTPGTEPASDLPSVPVAFLPVDAAETLRLIDDGGPFPYDQDGVTFQNRESLLPAHETGYYREFTVETPGSDDRGARRIIAGDGGELYYTDDHYESFVRISP